MKRGAHHVRSDVKAFLKALEDHPRPILTMDVLKQMRGMRMDPAMSPDLPIGILGEIRDVAMPGPGGELALRLFDVRTDRAPGPVVVFFHGGGFCAGSIDMHAALTADISRALDLPVVSVEYRLAPEHPWPAAPDDAEAAARWIAENGAAFGREFTALVLCGDSAGGNLSAVTSLALRDRPAALPVVLQILIYPNLDLRGGAPSRDLFASGFGLNPENVALYFHYYAADPLGWRASPVLADQTGAPATFVITAALDILRDEGRAYAAKTIEAGVRTCFLEIEGTIHGFATSRKVIPSARGDVDVLLTAARSLLDELGAHQAST